MLTTQDRIDITEIVTKTVADVINEVVMPAFETVALKSDVKKIDDKLIGLEGRFRVVETRLDVVECKLDRVIDNQILDIHKQVEFEKKIKKLETRRAST